LRSRGDGSRIRISRRRPIFTVESEPSSIARQTKANDVAVFAVRVCDPAQRVDTPLSRPPGSRKHLTISRGRTAFEVLGQACGERAPGSDIDTDYRETRAAGLLPSQESKSSAANLSISDRLCRSSSAAGGIFRLS
jgi:hypothetical protein